MRVNENIVIDVSCGCFIRFEKEDYNKYYYMPCQTHSLDRPTQHKILEDAKLLRDHIIKVRNNESTGPTT